MSSDNTMPIRLVAIARKPSGGECGTFTKFRLSPLTPEHIVFGREDAGNYTKILEGVMTSNPQAKSIREFRNRIEDVIFRVSPFDFSEDEMGLLFEEKRRGIAELEIAKVRKALVHIAVSARFIDITSVSLRKLEVDTDRLQGMAEQSAINAMLGGQDERAAWSMKDSPKAESRKLPKQGEIKFHVNRIQEQCWMLTNSLGLISGLVTREENEYKVEIQGHIEPALKLLTYLCSYMEGNLPQEGDTLLRSAIWRIQNALPR